MSKLPKNFEKILIGVAGLAALGFAALGFMKTSAVEQDFNLSVKGSGKNDASIPEALATAKAISSLTSNRTIERAEDEGRPVDLFVGIRLFADKNNPNVPIDIVDGKDVHEGIKNKLWIESGADITYANSPDRDDDGDGFSNRDEFEAKTHPVDAHSFPALINKLAYLKDESVMWYVDFGIDSQGKWAPKLLGNKADGKPFKNRVGAIDMIAVGDEFFKDGEFAKRFKFTGFAEEEVFNARINAKQAVRFGLYEELKPNKAGLKYKSQQNLPDAQMVANANYDRTAVLDLQAIGSEGKEFKVEEGTKFALPPDAAEKNFLLKSVTPEGIVVEYTDAAGAAQSLEIKKGGTP